MNEVFVLIEWEWINYLKWIIWKKDICDIISTHIFTMVPQLALKFSQSLRNFHQIWTYWRVFIISECFVGKFDFFYKKSIFPRSVWPPSPLRSAPGWFVLWPFAFLWYTRDIKAAKRMATGIAVALSQKERVDTLYNRSSLMHGFTLMDRSRVQMGSSGCKCQNRIMTAGFACLLY